MADTCKDVIKMEKEQYMPKDGKTIVFTNVMLSCEENIEEIHIGGRLNSLFVTHLPAFRVFADKNPDKDISIDVYSYALDGGSWQERKATKEEMALVIGDDFPYNYDRSILSCIDHDGPDQFVMQKSGDAWLMVSKDGITECPALEVKQPGNTMSSQTM